MKRPEPKAGPRRSRTGTAAAVLFASCLAASALAQPAFLVADIETGTVDSSTRVESFFEAARLGDFLYLVIRDSQHGEELWRTDGTAGRLELFLDLCPGACGSSPRQLRVFGDLLWFTADVLLGREVWISDGTRPGTRMLRDICPGPCTSAFGFPSVEIPGGEIFFPASDGLHGVELWHTDLTPEGTLQVADLKPGRRSAAPQSLTPFQGQLYFFIREELWKSDGTPGGTARIDSFCDPEKGCTGRTLGSTARQLLIHPFGNDPNRPQGPLEEPAFFRVSDGTPGGTRLLQDARGPVGGPGEAIPFGTDLLVSGFNAEGRPGLWRTDLEPYGTRLLREFDRLPAQLTLVGSRVHFVLPSEAAGQHPELWVSDGTPAGTRLLQSAADIILSPASSFAGRLFFALSEPETGWELWTSDGTPGGTRLFADLSPGPESSFPRILGALGPWLIFSADFDREIWRTDGSEEGTERLRAFEQEPATSMPLDLTFWNGRLYFGAQRSPEGRKLWMSDGTPEGTARPPGLDPDPWVFSPSFFTPFDGSLYFASGDLYRFTESGGITRSRGEFSRAQDLAAAGDRLFFAASPQGKTCCAWDCTDLFVLEAGSDQARQVGEINRRVRIEDPFLGRVFEDPEVGGLTPFGDRVVLVANDGEHGLEPWISDGSEGGTALLADLCEGACSSHPQDFLHLGPWLLFGAGEPDFEPSELLITRGQPNLCRAPGLTPRKLRRRLPAGLWRSDGTSSGTVRVAGFAGVPRRLIEFRGRAYFLTRTLEGDRLWSSDATADGTALVSDLSLDGSAAWAGALMAAGGRLFLSVSHPTTGAELWSSDGTAAGTHLVADLLPGPRGSSPHFLTPVGGGVVFAAGDAESGVEPWISDGTAEGTFRLQDIAPGRAASSPWQFTDTGEMLFFSADDGIHGRELWAVAKDRLPPSSGAGQH